MDKKLFEMHVNYGRMGDLDGLFVSTQKKVDALAGKNVYFGEVLGKHSEIDVDFEDHLPEFEVKSEDREFIKKLVEVVGSETISGFNPVEIFEEQERERIEEEEYNKSQENNND